MVSKFADQMCVVNLASTSDWFHFSADIKQQPEIKFRPIKESIRMAVVDISEYLIPLDPEIRQCVIDFKEER